jgi:hypothetical protein
VVVKDARTQAYQLLTAGDARVVTDICSDSWQGETITPLGSSDRAIILENSKNWSLADLDVTAFSYAPIPYSYDKKLATQSLGLAGRETTSHPTVSYALFLFFITVLGSHVTDDTQDTSHR